MNKGRKVRLLALHGKGTSAAIMRAQIKPLISAMEDEVQVEYLQGGVASAPYSGIESLFPSPEYWAWYNTPTAESLTQAHDRIKQCLLSGSVASSDLRATTLSLLGRVEALYTPPDTPSTPSSPTARKPWPSSYIGLETLVLTAEESCVTSPQLPFDGVICFSQGCAALTGLLLNMTSELPIKFAVVICGGRPFDGSFNRVDASNTKSIRLPSLHVHGQLDPGLAESRQLYSLYGEEERMLVELNIGHCPPRRTADVNKVVNAIRTLVSDLSM